jgi:hypothetical protein
MAYDKAELMEQAQQAIEEHELTTIAEVLSYLPCSESTLYETEDWKLEFLEPLKNMHEVKKTNLKAKMKK